jgi:hypothetical protein
MKLNAHIIPVWFAAYFNEQDGVAVMFQTCNRELLLSNLGRGNGHPDDTFSWFPRSLQANPEQYHLGHDRFLPILYDSLLANCLRIRLEIFGDIKSGVR